VYDRDNQLVPNLERGEFSIYEDKLLQEITYFGQDDVPSTVGIVIDTSGSMRDKFPLVDEATRLFLSLNHPENELFFISFKDQVRLEESFTRDVEDIHDALDNVIISGGTALYDAIYLALDHARGGDELKRVVLVFTDGEDKDSFYNYEELLEKVQESDVQLYIIAFLDPELDTSGGFFGIFKSEREKVLNRIKSIPESSGGESFFPDEIDQLDEIFRSIAYELRRQYRLAYISSNTVKDGAWRDIRVRIRDAKERSLKVRAKRGYYAKEGSTGESRD